MNKWIVLTVGLVLVLVLFFTVGSRLLKQEVKFTQDQAVTFANEELRYGYPNATIEIYGTENMSEDNSSWKIQARVIYGRNTLCPNLTLVELRYPRFGFVLRERIITENCRVLGCHNIPNCILAFPEEAILMPFDTERNPGIQTDLSNFIESAGPSNVNATAALQSSFSHGNSTYSDVWVVLYSAPNLNQSFETILNRTGGIAIEHYLKPKG